MKLHNNQLTSQTLDNEFSLGGEWSQGPFFLRGRFCLDPAGWIAGTFVLSIMRTTLP